MSKFKIQIASVSHREKLVSEIWYNDYLVAEINHGNKILNLEIYPSNEKYIMLPLKEFQDILEKAKAELLR